MAVLSKSEKIGGYTVQNLIKANHYTETYRVVDGDNRPFFSMPRITVIGMKAIPVLV